MGPCGLSFPPAHSPSMCLGFVAPLESGTSHPVLTAVTVLPPRQTHTHTHTHSPPSLSCCTLCICHGSVLDLVSVTAPTSPPPSSLVIILNFRESESCREKKGKTHTQPDSHKNTRANARSLSKQQTPLSPSQPRGAQRVIGPLLSWCQSLWTFLSCQNPWSPPAPHPPHCPRPPQQGR